MPASGKDFEGLTAALKEARDVAPREPRRRYGAIRAAVVANLDHLLALRDNGYSDEEIANIFRGKGFKVAGGTLKTYINIERAAKIGPQRSTKARNKAQKPPSVTKTSVSRAETARPSETAARPRASSGAAKATLSHKPNEDV